MPGWIIQGVRGEGKSLAAVGKIREYMLRGRPVATNLDLFLEHLLPADNKAIAYRLPDHPRLEDFELLQPAYDPKYKAEDMNGLLVLDELGTWLNSRNWNDKARLKMLNWLFLSRKDHWDLILLAQDHEMIDSQVRTTLCDYLVQASRLDRQKIPYLAPVLEFLGINSFMPRIHRYHVYYGLSMQQKPVETWTFTGKDIYYGYDTNQRFRDGTEAMLGTLVDMRATYTYLPVCYLTNRIFIERLTDEIARLRVTITKPNTMAKPKTGENQQLKIAILGVALVVFLGWRYFTGGFNLPKLTTADALAVQPLQPPAKNSIVPNSSVSATPLPLLEVQKINTPSDSVYVAKQTNEIIDYLLHTYRPRLSLSAQSPEMGLVGNVDFYDEFVLVETYSIRELHALGVTLVRKPYGADLLYSGKSFIVSAWNLPKQQPPHDIAVDSPADLLADQKEISVSEPDKLALNP